MSVLIETTVGDLVVDLHTNLAPVTTYNFLKLCKIQAYVGTLFYSVLSGFVAQGGDPIGNGSGGVSVFGLLATPPSSIPCLSSAPAAAASSSASGRPAAGGMAHRWFADEVSVLARHNMIGTLAMGNTGPGLNGSQFYITLAVESASLARLDGKHTVFGVVVEGVDSTLAALDAAVVDKDARPLKNIRIYATHVLADPFPDPPGLAELGSPSMVSPWRYVQREKRMYGDHRIDDSPEEQAALARALAEDEGHGASVEERRAARAARRRAQILEIVGDLPEADAAPPDNVLFVCKLNPVTEDDDLHTIFSQFGPIVECAIVRDKDSGESLTYAFIEFAEKAHCERAYFKMQNAVIDDRRIKVDFSQSVAKLKWQAFKRQQLGRARPAAAPPSSVSASGAGHHSSGHRRRRRRHKKSRSRSERTAFNGAAASS